MSSVDDIWASMQEENKQMTCKKSGGISEITGSRKNKNSAGLKPTNKQAAIVHNDIAGQMSLDQLMRQLKTLVHSLDDNNHTIRKTTLQSIDELLFGGKCVKLADFEYSMILREICKPLFKRISVKAEKCRELSLRIIDKLFGRATDLLPVISYYFPCLMQRMPSGIGYDEELKVFITDIETHEAFKRGRAVDRQDKGGAQGLFTHIVIEPSEEIRLILCQTLDTLITRLVVLDALSILQSYFSEVILFLQNQLKDPYPELRMLACGTIEKMARINEFEIGMKYYAVAMVRAVLPVLRHRHAKVRVAAVQCCAACVAIPDRDKCKGAGTEAMTDLVGFREENVLQVAAFYKSDIMINYLAELVVDPSVLVREALAAMLTVFLTEIGDRYDHQQRLLPYILDLLNDDNESVSKSALNCLTICGKQYEDDNKDSILEKRQYGVDGDVNINLSRPLPAPFTSRPSLGVRLYVRGNTKRFLSALLNELMNWISKTRLKSAGLLKMVVVLCEESLTMEAFNIIPSLIKALDFGKTDKDLDLQRQLLEIAELLGRYVVPDTYIRYIIPRLTGDPSVVRFATDAASRCTVMEVLGAMLTGSKRVLVADKFVDVADVVTDSFIITPESRALRGSALHVLDTLLTALETELRATTEAHYAVKGRTNSIKKVFASLLFDLSDESLRSQASRCLTRLATIATNSDINACSTLFKTVGADTLVEMMEVYEVDSDWSSQSLPHVCISALLTCPPLIVDDIFDRVAVMHFLCRTILTVQNARSIPSTLISTLLTEMNRLLLKLIGPAFDRDISIAAELVELFGSKYTMSTSGASSSVTSITFMVRHELSSIVSLFLLDEKWGSSEALQRCRFDLLELLTSDITELNGPVLISEDHVYSLASASWNQIVLAAIMSGSPVNIRVRAVKISERLLNFASNKFAMEGKFLPRLNDSELNGELNRSAGRLNVRVGVDVLLGLLFDPDDNIVIDSLSALLHVIPFVTYDNKSYEYLIPLNTFVSRLLNVLTCVSVSRDERFYMNMDYLLRGTSAVNVDEFARLFSEFESSLVDSQKRSVESMEFISNIKDHIYLLKSLSSHS